MPVLTCTNCDGEVAGQFEHVRKWRAPRGKGRLPVWRCKPSARTKVRKAFERLPQEERRKLLAEVAPCACNKIVDLVVKEPAAGVGALVGAVAGLAFSALRKGEQRPSPNLGQRPSPNL